MAICNKLLLLYYTDTITTPATSPRRYGDQLFFVAMAQEWRNGPRRLREHDDDDYTTTELNCWNLGLISIPILSSVS